GVLFRSLVRILEREHGDRMIDELVAGDPRLVDVLSSAVRDDQWLPLADLARGLDATRNHGGDPAELGRAVGRAAISASLPRYLRADPATMPPRALLRAAGTLWSRYHSWG